MSKKKLKWRGALGYQCVWGLADSTFYSHLRCHIYILLIMWPIILLKLIPQHLHCHTLWHAIVLKSSHYVRLNLNCPWHFDHYRCTVECATLTWTKVVVNLFYHHFTTNVILIPFYLHPHTCIPFYLLLPAITKATTLQVCCY